MPLFSLPCGNLADLPHPLLRSEANELRRDSLRAAASLNLHDSGPDYITPLKKTASRFSPII